MSAKALVLFICIFLMISCQKSGDTRSPSLQPNAPKPSSQPEQKKQPVIKDDSTKESSTHELAKSISIHVWQSPIGILFKQFVFEINNQPSMSEMAEAISSRTLSEPVLTFSRIEALRVMVDDLYQSNAINNPGVLIKIQMLNSRIEHDRMAMDTSGTMLPSMSQALPYFVAVAFLAGSSELKLQLWSVSRKIFANFRRQTLREPLEVPLLGLFGSKFFKGYRPRLAYSTFMHSAMAYMILMGIAGDHMPDHQTMNTGVFEREKLLEINGL